VWFTGREEKLWREFVLADDPHEEAFRRGDWAVGDDMFRRRACLASISTESPGANENALRDQERCICNRLSPNQGIGVGWSVSREATR
jgi:hypothetical protein